MSADASIRRVLATIDYLRVSTGDAPDAETGPWIPCGPLVSDPQTLAEVVASTMEGRGTSRADVATSLFAQGYAFRIASIAIGTWFLDGTVIDIDPATTAIRLGRHRPNAVHLHHATARARGERDATLAELHSSLIDHHLAPFVDTAHRSCRVGRELLWANLGAGCASSFGAFMGPMPERRLEIRAEFEGFLDAGRSELARSGRIVHVGPEWAWERSACCLWYKTDIASGQKCADCSLWSQEERTARYEQILAEIGS